MHRLSRSAAVVAALLALAIPAGTALANHDPDPPYLSSSQPGGYELYGFHHDQISPSVNCWAGIQRRGSDGWYRLWLKCQGDGRTGSLELRNLDFYDHGYATYSACQTTFCVKGPGTVLYYTGTFHPVAEEVSIKAASVNWRYQGGASTGEKCVASYRVWRGGRSPITGPVC